MRLKIEVQTISPLHIGGEVRQNTDADRPLLKQQDGYPYIPATSIKGRLRHEAESFLRAMGYPVCNAPIAEQMCQPENAPVCSICQIFGSPWYEAGVYFSDLIIQTSGLDIGSTSSTTLRMGNQLNRRRRVVEEKHLFSTELYAPGMLWRFAGEIDFNRPEYDLALLVMAARGVNMMGGSRSRGLGWCMVTLSCESVSLDPKALWDAWTEHHKKGTV